MEDKQFFFAAIYFAPYLAAVFMPSWRALALATAGWVIFGVWAFFIRPPSTGLEGAFEATLGALVIMGAVSGLLTRAVVLFLRDRNYPPALLVAITAAGAFVLPIIYILTFFQG